MNTFFQALQANTTYALPMFQLLGVLSLFGILDLVLKGWAMWRAVLLEKRNWFIMLLFVNSLGVLPIFFLLFTKDEYRQKFPKLPETLEILPKR